ncbi:hypothetical protein [Spirochaeta africana]|uniref:CBM6 domain-containing protein n=1 Tax=Spirochaeta africana (strain ATCC 700263 / DSM 8902 / Z-7692) TaxID=889378 RepID=H9UHP0_SPIAZ|nr:hypothetical protein [Spirochaeta africana]AFG37033.1 hypothetical protein Spiaf_0944 [Spirochaeta africana DSM 8902]
MYVKQNLRFFLIFGVVAGILISCVSQPQPAARAAGARTVTEVQVYEPNVPFEVLPDRVVQGERDAIAESPMRLTSRYFRRETTREIEKDLSALPQLSAPNYPLLETLYNLALEEALQNEEEDGTFRTGALWAGVWTRDIAYAVHLGLGPVFPELSYNSLMRKVNDMPEVIQDTGTGGAWPVSTDRVVWAIAAWDLYKVTGDSSFLADIYEILANTARRDIRVAYDQQLGLFLGESSFLDWREQTYPVWMNPVDIYEGYALGTLVGHAEMYNILGEVGALIGAPQSELATWSRYAQAVTEGIHQQLWLEDLGYYSGYQFPKAASGYSDTPLLNQQSDSLGTALAVLTGVAGENAAAAVTGLPVVLYGVPSIYPQNPHAPPYHNKGIWPFVVAYYTWAGAETGNDAAVTHGMQSLMRAAALFMTNKENMVYDTGHSVGTQLNSDRQLWSVAGFLTNVYRVVFGLDYQLDGLGFKPFVPQFLEGPFELANLRYRDALLSIEVQGRGNEIRELRLNGELQDSEFVFPADATGEHRIEIVLADNDPGGSITMGTTDAILPHEPLLESVTVAPDGEISLSWEPVPGAEYYEVLRNGIAVAEIPAGQTEYRERYQDPDTDRIAAFSVRTYNGSPVGSLASSYGLAIPASRSRLYQAEEAAGAAVVGNRGEGFTGEGYVEIDMDSPALRFRIEVNRAGEYALRFRYANGNGPINTENKAALRSVYIDNGERHTLLMPQLGEWQRWEYSNSIVATLDAGSSEVVVRYEDLDRNMHGRINGAWIDHLQVVRIE